MYGWKECINEAFCEAEIKATEEQIELIISWAKVHADILKIERTEAVLKEVEKIIAEKRRDNIYINN